MSSTEAGVFDHIFGNIPSGWELKPLADVIDFQEGPGILAKDFHKTGVPLLRLSSISGGMTTFDGCNYLDPNKVKEKWSHFRLKTGDILLSTSGSLGRVSEVAPEQEGSLCYTGIIRFRPRNSCLRYSYIKYFLQSSFFEKQASACAAGSVLKHFGPTHLKTMSILIPPEEYQAFIERQLLGVDKKIALNTQTNQTLEQIAQTIFKSWFVDFDPVKAKMTALAAGGSLEDAERAAMCAISGKDESLLAAMQREQPAAYAELAATAALFPAAMQASELGDVPEGWEIMDFGSVSKCFDNKRIPLSKRQREQRQGNIPYYGATSVMDHVDEAIFDGVYLLLGEDGSVLKDDGTPFAQYIWGKSWVNNHAHVLQGVGDISTEYLKIFIETQNISAYVTGAVQLKLNQKNMNGIPFIKAPELINIRFTSIIEAFYKTLRNKSDENKSLILLRDTLLPKLLSGEVDLSSLPDSVEVA